VEAAIEADPDLTPDNKRVLLDVYRSLKRKPARSGAEATQEDEVT
jgi:hypothetical protein